MKKNHRRRARGRIKKTFKFPEVFHFPGRTGRWAAGILFAVAGLVLALGFFGLAGMIGNWLAAGLRGALGGAAFLLPAVFFIAGGACAISKQARFAASLSLASVLLLAGAAGFLANLDFTARGGGDVGYYLGLPAFNLFGSWVAGAFFAALFAAGVMVFWWLLGRPAPDFSKFRRRRRAQKKPKNRRWRSKRKRYPKKKFQLPKNLSPRRLPFPNFQ